MMNRNLFLRELRSNALSLLIWTSVITALTALTMSFYGVFLENNEKILAMISIIPEGTLQFKGISDVNDLFSVLGFYSANNVIYMLVLGSIYSIVLSSGILLREEVQQDCRIPSGLASSPKRNLFQQGGSSFPECCSD